MVSDMISIRGWICGFLVPTALAQWADPSLTQVALGANKACEAGSIQHPALDGIRIISLTAAEQRNFTYNFHPRFRFGRAIHGLNFCNVTVIYTHPGWNDEIKVTTFLPMENWNGRFQGNGGGGWVTGGIEVGGITMMPSLEAGFAVSTTDGGHSSKLDEASGDDMSWAFTSSGNINWPLFIDFSHVALHDMATIGKALTEAFYGTPPKYAYFYGGSTSGRQAYMLAQRYPDDFDGILGFCPAINWDGFQWSPLWAHRVMDKKGVYPRPCEFEAITAAAMKACDGLDGVEDGIVSMPSRCFFNASTLVGQPFNCGGKDALFTLEAAEAANAAWNGPRSVSGEFQWYGYGRDAKMWQFGALHTSCEGEGAKCAPVRLSIAESYARYFVAKKANLDLQALGHSQWDDLFVASRNEYESITGTSDPDLSRFRKAGGKLPSWHGMADQIIPVNGTVDYTYRVLKKDPKAHDYFRMFLAPGADHSISNGLAPRNTLSALIDWVEKGIAPITLRVEGLNAYGKHMTRDICMYPKVQHYVGGDPASSTSFACV